MKLHVPLCLVTVLFLTGLCGVVLAHSAAEMGIPPDQYDKGIPVFWPFHALFMSAGLVLLLSGAVIMRYHKTKNWYRSHALVQEVGGFSLITGLIIGFFMVARSGTTHLRYLHGILGAGTILIIMGTLIIGYSITHASHVKAWIRKIHRVIGGVAIGLVVINILLGISMMNMVLAQ